MSLNVLIACEFSGVVRRAFRALGHGAWSCDLLPAEDAGNHIEGSQFHLEGDVLNYLHRGWDLMIAHPPCTYLCRSGWHWVNKPDCETHPLKGEPRRRAAIKAAEFFMALWNAPISRICIENPKPICHVHLPKETQNIQPWQFGHGEVKGTCLWLKNLPLLQPTNIVGGREAKVHKATPRTDRWKERSRTYPGIAKAMAEQWGGL